MITPIIMEDDIKVVRRKIEQLKQSSEKRIQFDIGDGMFSDWVGVSPLDLRDLDLEGLEIELHLLVDDPVEWIAESLSIKPKRIIGQIEHMGSQMYFLDEVGEGGVVGGLALLIETPIAAIEKEALEKVEVILLLSVPAGTSGSRFDERVIEKIKDLRKIYKGEIMIDGGINEDTMQRVLSSGASSVAVNSSYWKEKKL